ncbi:Presilphiperfolan-8-beta-ol synthase [Paramyrothecium foliicola]|nr:Presilphiperfolan-8-beta-ol synthase [Paramyrothecium foliicola]
MADGELSQSEVIAALKGHTLRVPDLTKHFQSWPPARTNPRYPELRDVVDRTIRQIAVTQAHVERRLRDDIALLTCLWFPDAEWRELEALGLFAVWLICWDDTVDANEGDLAGNFASAEAWRQATLLIAQQSLGLGDQTMEEKEADKADIDALNAVLRDFGHRLMGSGASLAQRQGYFDELAFFISSCATEQKMRLAGRVPRYDAYMDVRLGTIGGALLCSLLDFADKRHTPTGQIMRSEHGAALRKQASTLLSLLNDVLSLKKELSTDCVINAVASLLTPGKTLNDVVGEVYEKMGQSVVVFDAAAAALLDEVRGNGELEHAARRYADECRCIVTGTLEFT